MKPPKTTRSSEKKKEHVHIQVLKSELAWCKRNHYKNDKFQDGFISGIKQAIYLLKEIEKRNIYET